MEWRRIARVATWMAGLGILFGAGAAAVGVLIPELITGSPATDFRNMLELLTLAAAYGGAFGAVLAPLVMFGLLRHVPIGKAIAWTGAGTVLGCVLALTVTIGTLGLLGPLGPPVAGFLLGAVGARVSHRLSRRGDPSELLSGPNLTGGAHTDAKDPVVGDRGAAAG